MRKAFCLFLVELAIVAAGIGMDRLFPVMSAHGWFVIAFMALAAIPVIYWPEIKGRWTGLREKKTNPGRKNGGQPITPDDEAGENRIPLADAVTKAWEIEEIRRLPEFETLARDRPQDVLRRLAERIFDGGDPNLSIRGVIGNPPIEQTVEQPHEYDFVNDLTEMTHITGDGRRYRELRVRWSEIERSIRGRVK